MPSLLLPLTLRRPFLSGILGAVLSIAIGCSAINTTLSHDPNVAWEQIKENYYNGHYLTASEQLKIFTLANSAYTKIDSAHYLLALSHEHLKEYILAANAYERLIRDYPNSGLADVAQFGIAESYNRQSPNTGLAQENTETAITEYQILLEEYPGSPKVKQAEERIFELRSKLAEKDYRSARLYHRQKDYRAALIYYNFVLTLYYDTSWGDETLFYAGECYYERDEYTEALESFGEFVQRYPEHEFIVEAQQYLKILREYLEEEAKKVTTGTRTPEVKVN